MTELPTSNDFVRYLLDRLPEAEAEHFDERSVADDAFAAGLRQAEEDLIDGYVRGDLDAETRLQFESIYLTSSRRRERVEFARALQQRITAAPVTPPAPPVAIAAPPPTVVARASVWRALVPAMLALVVVALVVDRIWLRRELTEMVADVRTLGGAVAEIQRQHAGLGASNVTAIVLQPSVVGADRPTTMSLAPGASSLLVELRLSSHQHASYRAVVIDPVTSAEIWRSEWIAASGAAGAPAVVADLPATLLKPQAYTIELLGRDAPSGPEMSVARYAFERLPR